MPYIVLAADLGERAVSAALLSAEGKSLGRKSEAVDPSSPKGLVDQICRVARELAGNYRIRAAGVTVPGRARQ